MELKDIRREIAWLARIMDTHGITELEMADGEFRVRLKRGGRSPAIPAPRREATPAYEAGARADTAEEARAVQPGAADLREDRVVIAAPMVGTFYRAPSPDAEPYVEVGSTVTPGQTVCIVEAMKIMNEIQAEVEGRVVEILVENAQPVEYGQPLFVLEKL